MIKNQIVPLSPREQVDIARRFGLKAALFASAVGISSGVVPGLSDFVLREARAQKKAKHRLRFGAGVIAPANDRFLSTGVYEFVRLVEERSDGEIAIQLIDNSQACAENTCGDRVANGILDIGSSSAQNLGAVMPYSIALDWPFLWRDRTEIINFLFSKESNRLYRDVIRKNYGIVPLWGSGELRNVMMGLKYSDMPAITSPAGLQGAKIRVTNSEMIANFAQSMKMNPIPLAWTELLEGLKSGVVDAAETWPGAAVGFGMATVLSQDVGIGFSPGIEMTFISARSFDKLPDDAKTTLLEAAYDAMRVGYEGVAEAQNTLIGNGPNPAPTSEYRKGGVKAVRLSEDQRAEFETMGDVERNSELYSRTRTNMDAIAGLDVFGALKEIRANLAGKPLQPVKWWL